MVIIFQISASLFIYLAQKKKDFHIINTKHLQKNPNLNSINKQVFRGIIFFVREIFFETLITETSLIKLTLILITLYSIQTFITFDRIGTHFIDYV